MALASLLSIAVLLSLGLAVRAGVPLLRRLYIPAAVVAGVIGLLVTQLSGNRAIIATIADDLRTWPTPLIALVFATLLLTGSDSGGFVNALKRGARSGVLAWVIILGQIVIGLSVYLVAVRPNHPAVPPTFGQLLEVSWAGGHGSSTAMGAVFASQGFPEGKDIAFFLATVGLIYGVVSGLVIVNIAIRKGWVANPAAASAADQNLTHFSSTARPLHEALLDGLLIVAFAYGVGYGLQQLFVTTTTYLTSDVQTQKAISNVPLFLFTLIGGLSVRQVMRQIGLTHRVDPVAISAIAAIAMDVLIVAAMATMRVNTLAAFAGPIFLLLLLAAVWSAFSLVCLSRWLLPKAYWFELGLLNYGFSTANTPQGFMLLKIVDPNLRTRAAEDYAVAAPLSAPFIGGGIITFVAMPLLLIQFGAAVVLLGCVVLMGVLLLIGFRLARTGSGSI